VAPSKLARAIRKLRQHGLGHVLTIMRYRLGDWLGDRRLGIRAGGTRRLDELGVGGASNFDYGPTCYHEFRDVMRHIDFRPGEDVFIDFGSGMGRVVIMAARHPFRKVIGVELAEALTQIACRNLERARRRLVCSNVDLVTADATAYAIPPEATVLFFCNPFGGEVLARVMENIRRSASEHPRPVRVVYLTAGEPPPPQSWLVKRQELKSFRRCVIYDVRV
jgi:hypothetical protein